MGRVVARIRRRRRLGGQRRDPVARRERRLRTRRPRPASAPIRRRSPLASSRPRRRSRRGVPLALSSTSTDARLRGRDDLRDARRRACEIDRDVDAARAFSAAEHADDRRRRLRQEEATRSPGRQPASTQQRARAGCSTPRARRSVSARSPMTSAVASGRRCRLARHVVVEQARHARPRRRAASRTNASSVWWSSSASRGISRMKVAEPQSRCSGRAPPPRARSCRRGTGRTSCSS